MVRPHWNTAPCAVRYRAGVAPSSIRPQTHRTWPAVLALLAVIGGVFFAPRNARAQEFRGTISGTVTDTSGAVIPGAEVTVREVRTGTVAHTTTDGAGQYTIPFLLPGQYELTVSATGFQKLVHSNVPLSAQDHLVIPLQLKIGSVAQTVTVSGAPPLLDTANASVGQVIETSSVENMPINGRTPTTLTELAPGVITTAPPQLIHPFDNNAGNQWSIGGTPNQVSEVLLDGSPDETLLGALAYAPTEDSVAQVSVRPFDTDASFGHTIGGVINQITKSGTNSFHGSAYEFYQINSFDANYYFNNRASIPVPGFHFNQYGVSVGGPIVKNKVFFFFAWEGLRDINPANSTLTVPTAAEKSGDFSQVLTAGCGGSYHVDSTGTAICNSSGKVDPNQLYNPFTATQSGKNIVRQPIPNNQLASTGHALSPIALDYLKLYPSPNVTGNPDGSDNYVSNAPSTDTYDNEFGRLDYNFSARDHIFLDARHNNRYQLKNDYFGNGATGTTLYRENLGASIDNVYTINPTTILDTRVNWTWFNEVHGTPAQKYSASSVGFPGYMDTSSLRKQLPFIGFNGSCGSHTSYQCFGDTGSALDPTTSYQFFVDVVKEIGKHTLKVGFDGRQYRISIQNFGDSAGNFTIGTNFVTSGTTGAAQTFGGDLAQFMLGLANSGDFAQNQRSDYHQFYLGSFVQDDWRVSDRLTLNLGLRYDFDTPFREKFGRTVDGFNPGAGIAYTKQPAFSGASVSSNGETFTVSGINTLGGLTFPNRNNGAVYETNDGFLSPRIGFSYSVDSKTVARGGFGIFVQPETLTSLAATGGYSSAAVSNSEGFSAATTFVSTTNSGLSPANTLSNPFPTGFTPAAGASLGASTNLGQAISFLAPVQHDPYSERWDIGFQRSLTNNSMLQVLYVGNHALHLPIQQQDINATQIQYLSRSPWRDQARASAYGQSVTNPFKGTLPSVNGVANSTSVNTASTVSFSSLLVPYPQF
ncbi:MAG TPA: carboxypeptidase regulatory-like domain-containing protein, partial [Acidobacteriaceae bacterium]|nr:carboxypeptidase regulatory-like domain-containing protein [Acidobacteriaceae bacterium]